MVKRRAPGWEKVADWYDKITGTTGHYYQKEIILPKVVQFLKKRKAKTVLDLACGQGVLARALPENVEYVGVDIASSLIQSAEKQKKSKKHAFVVGDVSSAKLSLEQKGFDAATVILALQDIGDVSGVFQNAKRFLRQGATLILVLNHPCFRIPRQTGWVVDDANKMQSRQIKAYMSSLEVPISVNPGKKAQSEQVVYHHQPLSFYSQHLFDAGFCIEQIEEWTSNKESTGAKARMENRARKEFPLFLCLICRKV